MCSVITCEILGTFEQVNLKIETLHFILTFLYIAGAYSVPKFSLNITVYGSLHVYMN